MKKTRTAAMLAMLALVATQSLHTLKPATHQPGRSAEQAARRLAKAEEKRQLRAAKRLMRT